MRTGREEAEVAVVRAVGEDAGRKYAELYEGVAAALGLVSGLLCCDHGLDACPHWCRRDKRVVYVREGK